MGKKDASPKVRFLTYSYSEDDRQAAITCEKSSALT